MEGEAGVAVEYFFASDASAIIEHTNRVIFLEVPYYTELYYTVLYTVLYCTPNVSSSSRTTTLPP